MKYARLERERRFLLDVLPTLDGARVLRVTDRYLDCTRLRLRLVEEDGCDPVRKLGQKVPIGEGVSVVAHTTLYLDDAEFSRLSELPARELRKTRRVLADWAFDEHPSGLLLAETEREVQPWFAFIREVTDEAAFTGGVLARGAR
ncbi:MAG: hypothetical protein JWO27_3173 [Frankiales bacterium]|jgi:hypothetical protein|nr:hypothetical protein [Frankiales bacterium]